MSIFKLLLLFVCFQVFKNATGNKMCYIYYMLINIALIQLLPVNIFGETANYTAILLIS